MLPTLDPGSVSQYTRSYVCRFILTVDLREVLVLNFLDFFTKYYSYYENNSCQVSGFNGNQFRKSQQKTILWFSINIIRCDVYPNMKMLYCPRFQRITFSI